MFLEWLKKHVLAKLGPGWILSMDNASIYRMTAIKELCAQLICYTGRTATILARLNPIEQAFHVLNIWIRRHQEETALFSNFGAFLEMAVEAAGGIHAKKHFAKSGYNVSQLNEQEA